MNTLDIVDLRKSFGARKVLDGMSFAVRPGEIFGLLGPNGCGKTTTINILCNLLASDGGSVVIAGLPPGDAAKRLLGFAPQEISVYQDLTCAENLDFFARLHGLARPERRQRVAELIRDFDLGDYADSRVRQLSGGWQRRINIAAALVHRPVLMLLDEPTAALDIEARHGLWQMIRRLQAGGMAIVLTTHDLEEAELLCSRIGIVQDGRLAAEGAMSELRARIAAEQLASLETADEDALRRRAEQCGWPVRNYAGKLTLWLPRVQSLADVLAALRGIEISSVALGPVRLQHVYLEATGSAAPA